MIVVVDLIRKNNEHHVFNFETIKAIDTLESDCVYYLDQNSSAIETISDKTKVKKINVKKDKLYFWFISSFYLLKILFHYIQPNRKVILLSATPLQYKICSVLSSFLDLNIIIFMHGELGYISSPTGIGQRLGKYFLLSSFKTKSKVIFVAINEYIYTRLRMRKDFLARMSFIEHPLQDIDLCSPEFKSDFLKIGSFGIHSKEKNSQNIYELAELMDSGCVDNVELLTIGVSNGSFEYDKNKNVKHFCRGELNSSLIPKEEFISHVKMLDFALFFNGAGESYDLIPSGVFADCIALGIPIIALKNSKMEFFFDRYGDVGVLCDNINQMAQVIGYLSENTRDKIRYKSTMAQVKTCFTTDAYQLSIYRVLHG